MGNFRDKISRFMYGRYGADQLYYALIVFYFVLIVLNSFTRSSIFGILSIVVLALMIYRVLSKNIYKRQSENEIFLKIWNPMKQRFSITIRRIKESRTHVFHKCPHCNVVLRLPRKKGKHTVKCPRCHNEFEMRVMW